MFPAALAGTSCGQPTRSAAPLLETRLPARFEREPNVPGERAAVSSVLGRDVGASEVAVEHLHVTVPPTPGELTVYALTFDHSLKTAEVASVVTSLDHYVPTSGLRPVTRDGVRLLVREDDAVLASTVLWTHDTRALVVTGGHLDDEEAFVGAAVGR